MSDSLSFEFEFNKSDLSALTKAIHVPWWMRMLKWIAVALGLVATVMLGFVLLFLDRMSLTDLVIPVVALLFALVLLLSFEPTMRANKSRIRGNIGSRSDLDHHLETPVDQGRRYEGVI